MVYVAFLGEDRGSAAFVLLPREPIKATPAKELRFEDLREIVLRGDRGRQPPPYTVDGITVSLSTDVGRLVVEVPGRWRMMADAGGPGVRAAIGNLRVRSLYEVCASTSIA